MHFLRNSRPTSAEITQLSEDLEMERETVRVWFCNRRQKEKRIGSHGEVRSNFCSKESERAHIILRASQMGCKFGAHFNPIIER